MYKKVMFLTIVLIFSSTIVFASTYYISPADLNANRSASSNQRQKLNKVIRRMLPGDTLILQDGIYNEKLIVQVSGTKTNPIIIKAQHDGKAIIDGRGSIYPLLRIRGKRYVDIEGIVFQNSAANVIEIGGGSTYINVRRVSAYNANPNGNYMVFSLDDCNYVLLEDCVGAGDGRVIFNVFNSNHVKLRRCYSRFRYTNSRHGPNNIQIYGSPNTLVENCITTKYPNYTDKYLSGLHFWANTKKRVPQNISKGRAYGNIVFNLKIPKSNNADDFSVASKSGQQHGIHFKDNVGINNYVGMSWFGDDNLVVERITLVNHHKHFWYRETYSNKVEGYHSVCTLKNSILLNGTIGIDNGGEIHSGGIRDGRYFGGLINSYNVLYGIENEYSGGATRGEGEINIDPGFETNIFGYGAYLKGPTNPVVLKGGKGQTKIGAQVIYRYVDGVLTTEHLWPWPMEQRLINEIGISVTWERKGGLWKTLNNLY